ncbi:hypothetical protein PMAYCL1PPCAC_05230, partial [Pristionchus mayeri]
NYQAPERYAIGTVDIEEDYTFIHAMWPYGAHSPAESTKERLTHLPSVCIRSSNGSLAAWELMNSMGMMTHLFTLEAHRRKGLGLLVENLLSQCLIGEDVYVFKYVSKSNAHIVNSTKRNPFWSQWTTLDDQGEKREMMWTFSGFKYTG